MNKRKKDRLRKAGARQRQILGRLGQTWFMNKYEISKHLGLSYSTVQRVAQVLLSDGLIRAAKSGTSKRGDKVEYYALTPRGLLILLWGGGPHSGNPEAQPLVLRLSPTWKKAAKVDITNIATRHHNLLPQVLSNWKHFVDCGVENLASRSLKGAVDWYFRNRRPKLEMEESDIKEQVPLLTFLALEADFTAEERLKWFQALAKHDGLYNLLLTYLEKVTADLEERLNEWRTLENELEDIQIQVKKAPIKEGASGEGES